MNEGFGGISPSEIEHHRDKKKSSNISEDMDLGIYMGPGMRP